MPTESKLWVTIVTQPSNLSFSTTLALNGSKWDVTVTNNEIRATSHRTYTIPGSSFDDRDKVIQTAMNQIVGHLRNICYFSAGLEIRWGYEGGYDGTVISGSEKIFPSIHQNSSLKYNERSIQRAQRIIKDIGSSRRRGLRLMLNYWRRAYELDELGFDSEAFLNYYKVIECLAELNGDKQNKRNIVARFSPGKAPQKTLCARYGAKTYDQQYSLHKQITFTANALSAANMDSTLRRGLFIKTLDIVYMRHYWNVAHKLLRINPYDGYDAIGQHSDEFSLVMIENIYIRKITKLLILGYVKPRQYHFILDGNLPMVMPVSGKGSTLV